MILSAFPRALRSLIVVTAMVCAFLFITAMPSEAAITPPAICSSQPAGAFVSSVVACLEEQTREAADVYIHTLTLELAPFDGACIVLAIVLFGMRLSTAGSDQLVSDTMLLFFKVIVALTLIVNAQGIFDSLLKVMGELIGYAVATLGTGRIPSVPCHAVPPTGTMSALITTPGTVFTIQQFNAWSIVDCVVDNVFGLTATTAVAGFLGVVVICLFSGTLGIIAAFLGVTALIAILFTVCRAILAVMFAILTLGFLMILTPIIAPLVVFSPHQASSPTRKVFDRWISLILATLIEPMFVVAFLTMAILVIDTFIDSTTLPCTPDAPQGAVTQVCSFVQIFTGAPGEIQQGTPFFSWKTAGDVGKSVWDTINQMRADGMTGIADSLTNAWNDHPKEAMGIVLKSAVTMTLEPVSHFLTLAGDLALKSFARVANPAAKIPNFLFMLTTLMIVIYLMSRMMELVQRISSQVVQGTNVGLYRLMSAPWQSVITTAVVGANASMRRYQKKQKESGGKGGIIGSFARNAMATPGLMASGAKGAMSNVLRQKISPEILEKLPKLGDGADGLRPPVNTPQLPK